MQLETCDTYQSANHHIRLKMLATSNMTLFFVEMCGENRFRFIGVGTGFWLGSLPAVPLSCLAGLP